MARSAPTLPTVRPIPCHRSDTIFCAPQAGSWGVQSRLRNLTPSTSFSLTAAQQIENISPFYRWITEVGGARALPELGLTLSTTLSPKTQAPPYRLMRSLPISSASALQTPGSLGRCGSESLVPGACAQAPSSPQLRAPPRPSSSVRIILAVERLSLCQ